MTTVLQPRLVHGAIRVRVRVRVRARVRVRVTLRARVCRALREWSLVCC